ncbi:MAG TPA: MurR/RpiR family transcriptional regulator [Bacillota bacterium]|nr:MurR/RpiR family transcriptional regulator [Bacillota bacterium]
MKNTNAIIKRPIEELLNHIREEQENFSSAQRQVALFVIDNYFQIPFLSITSLAEKIGVSDSTVIKFCNRLGYTRFTEFKRAISECAHTELVMSNKLLENSADPMNDEFMATVMKEDIASIEATLTSSINKESLLKLIPIINSAKHIYITGGRSSTYFAGLFAAMLRYLGLKVYDIESAGGDYLDRIAMIEKEDLLIAISLPRYTAQVVNIVKILHEKGVPVVLLTDTGLSPAYPYADIAFHCSVGSSYYFPCNAGSLSIISVICRAVSAARKNDASLHIRQLEQSLLSEKIFL